MADHEAIYWAGSAAAAVRRPAAAASGRARHRLPARREGCTTSCSRQGPLPCRPCRRRTPAARQSVLTRHLPRTARLPAPRPLCAWRPSACASSSTSGPACPRCPPRTRSCAESRRQPESPTSTTTPSCCPTHGSCSPTAVPAPHSSRGTCANPRHSCATRSLTALIDFDEPVAMIATGLLHFLLDHEQPAKHLRTLMDACPPAAAWSSPTAPPTSPSSWPAPPPPPSASRRSRARHAAATRSWSSWASCSRWNRDWCRWRRGGTKARWTKAVRERQIAYGVVARKK